MSLPTSTGDTPASSANLQATAQAIRLFTAAARILSFNSSVFMGASFTPQNSFNSYKFTLYIPYLSSQL